MNKTVIAVVVTYNRKELLKECVEALLNQSYENCVILIVDNASTDGTYDYMKEYIDNKKLVYKNTGANLGGAGGFNYGMKEAIKMGCDYVWVMDDDCIVKENTLEELIKFASNMNDNFGYLSSTVKWTDGTICKMNVQRKSIYKKVDDFSLDSQKVKMASFVSMFFKSSVIEDVGLPIKDFFIWGDDWEYSKRISNKYDCYMLKNSEVIHKCKNNMGVDISKEENNRLDRFKFCYRNEGYMYRKSGLFALMYMFLKIFYHIFKVLTSKCKNKFKKIKIILKFSLSAFSFHPKIEYIHNENSNINILEFFGEPLSYGGQEAFILNMYRNFKKTNNYTFFTPFYCDNKELVSLAEQNDDKVVWCDKKFMSPLRKFYIKRTIKKFLKSNKFDVIHIHSGSIFTLLNVAKIAKKRGIKKVIVHSHCTGNKTIKYKLIKKYSDRNINKYVDEYFACSLDAAAWKFPQKIINEKKYSIINNGLNIADYKYDNSTRIEYREKLNLEDKITICHVGRFEEQKNHAFILELAKSLKKKENEYKFVLIGDGSLKKTFIDKVNEAGLNEYFEFLEKRNDVAKIMMASDVFVFPSIFEGLGIVAIESQATGLPTVCSTYIPRETNISELVKYVSLDDMDSWVDFVLNSKTICKDREKFSNLVANAGFDSKENARFIESRYLN